MSAVADLIAETIQRHAPAARRIAWFDPHDAARCARIGGTRVVAIQPWRPTYDALRAAGVDAFPTPPDDLGVIDCAVVEIGRQRARTRGRIAEALRRCGPDGLLIVAGPNDLGPASYTRDLALLGATSRSHARVAWARARDALAAPLAESWTEAARLRPVPPDGHIAAPGIFAWDRIDEGSTRLADALPHDLGGAVADLGAGWGFLSSRILARHGARLTRLDPYEADWLALEAARRNIETVRGTVPVELHWHDVTSGLSRGDYDAVVMNPPFHDTRIADPAIGRDFIAAAAAALRPDGRLWMVANRTLPYEAEIARLFARHAVTPAGTHYKLIAAVR